MSEEFETDMDGVPAETERLGRLLAQSARARGAFMASAIDVWERANPDRPVAELLRCDESQLWRVAVTPRPTGPGMVERTLAIATALGVNPSGLVNLLRFAEGTAAFASVADSGERLMAALDADNDDSEETDR